VVEGFFALFELWQTGFKNVAALMGSSMSPEQEELIVEAVGKDGQAILMFDGDKRARSALARPWPGLDPASLSKR